MTGYYAKPALIPAPVYYEESGEYLYAATLRLTSDAPCLPQLKALRDEINRAFGESVLSPESSAEEFAYFEKQTHEETPLWGANFRRGAAPTRSIQIHQIDEHRWLQQTQVFTERTFTELPGAYIVRVSESGIELLIPQPMGRPAAGSDPKLAAAEGASAACATLMQLLHLGWDGWRFSIPRCTIIDWPELSWRGLMIDSARHFVPIPELKKILSMAWLYKLNRFHWHLTDDQGWRLELVSLPEATGSGATRPGGDPNRNGYYSQDEVRDLVAYAAERGITVIPELDLPGHVQALLAGHPEFACTPGPHQVRTEWGISEDVLCMGNPEGLEFTLKAWDEVCELFPGPYVHIGGDEVPTTRWEQCPRCAAKKTELGFTDWIDLHGYFVAALTEYLHLKGKTVFGWDEVLDSSIPNQAHVVHWRAWLPEQSKQALEQGRCLIRSPYFPYYFDFVQTDDRILSPGLAYRSPEAASLRRVYEYDPFKGLVTDRIDKSERAASLPAGSPGKHYRGSFLGIQANLWTEYVRDGRRLEYMLFPRLLALAETAWNGTHRGPYETFIQRLQVGHSGPNHSGPHGGIFAQRGINFCPLL